MPTITDEGWELLYRMARLWHALTAPKRWVRRLTGPAWWDDPRRAREHWWHDWRWAARRCGDEHEADVQAERATRELERRWAQYELEGDFDEEA